MSRRTARGNRIGLAVVGAALVLAGAAALIRGLDLLPGLFGAPDAAVTDRATRDFVAEQDWFWPVLAAVLIVIGLLALRWLLVQARTGAAADLRIESDPRRGTTTVPARAMTNALVDDLTGGPQLRRVRATLKGSAVAPRLDLSAGLPARADPMAVREQLGRALERHRQALEVEHLPTTVLLRSG
jgi:hypothetical protein